MKLQSFFKKGGLPWEKVRDGKGRRAGGVQPLDRFCGGGAGEGKIHRRTDAIDIGPCPGASIGDVLFRRSVAGFQYNGVLPVSRNIFAGGAEIDQMQPVINTKNQVVGTDIAVYQSFFMDFGQ